MYFDMHCIHTHTSELLLPKKCSTLRGREHFDSDRVAFFVTLIRPPESGPNSVIFLNILRLQHTCSGPEIYPTGLFLFRSSRKNIKQRPFGT